MTVLSDTRHRRSEGDPAAKVASLLREAAFLVLVPVDFVEERSGDDGDGV